MRSALFSISEIETDSYRKIEIIALESESSVQDMPTETLHLASDERVLLISADDKYGTVVTNTSIYTVMLSNDRIFTNFIPLNAKETPIGIYQCETYFALHMSDATVFIYTLGSDTPTRLPTGAPPAALLAASKDALILCVPSPTGTRVRLFSPTTGKDVLINGAPFKGIVPLNGVCRMSVSPDGKLVSLLDRTDQLFVLSTEDPGDVRLLADGVTAHSWLSELPALVYIAKGELRFCVCPQAALVDGDLVKSATMQLACPFAVSKTTTIEYATPTEALIVTPPGNGTAPAMAQVPTPFFAQPLHRALGRSTRGNLGPALTACYSLIRHMSADSAANSSSEVPQDALWAAIATHAMFQGDRSAAMRAYGELGWYSRVKFIQSLQGMEHGELNAALREFRAY
ncbi:hypothetical protein J8273_3803 [Carpediemonas membranifera]|uniref:IFT80 second beta-propeller domain-containing protein n=1 Tax=Carpediemonas membranifera TaxID=201153 RepID=A0A8J6EAD7_9EUKA|nr:hypothetical protein J8273_3803 [Carpediemonas membranifera]|eukprot:KAG9394555.1 hypothetical protein J8273_3803 [Carpediemonas membranifera]